MRPTTSQLWATLAASAVQATSLADVKHIVLFMQENRAFDHVRCVGNLHYATDISLTYRQYFGTMAGVRGFGDPNVQVNDDGYSVFEQ